MKPTRILSPEYREVKVLDLSTDWRMLLVLNLVGFVLLFPAGWLFLRAFTWLRPGEALPGISLEISGFWQVLGAVGWFVLVYTVLVFLHEAVHGLFFWLITHSRPAFGFKGVYAYAYAPGWYIPRNPYLVVSLAPLVVLSVLGVALFMVVPADWLLFMLALLTLNVGGAAGDLYVAAWLLTCPVSILAQDRGDSFSIYAWLPGKE